MYVSYKNFIFYCTLINFVKRNNTDQNTLKKILSSKTMLMTTIKDSMTREDKTIKDYKLQSLKYKKLVSRYHRLNEKHLNEQSVFI